ncbi:retrovirus-related pol polyprotein from transposon TNT 1-94 [Tanacetum coccineum]
MDYGGYYHMTPERDFLFEFKEFFGGTVLLGDNKACAIRGTRKVRVQMKINLISLGTMDREGYTVKLHNGRVKVIKGSLMVLSGTIKVNCVYSLDGWDESGEASVGSGIEIHLTVEGTPQQNGLVERMNRMLLNKVSIYIIGKEYTYGFMVRTSGELRDVKDIWLDDVKPKIIISRDVVFNESIMYKDTLKGAGAADSRKEVEFEVQLLGNRVEPTMDPHTGENSQNEDEEQDGNVSLSRPSRSKEEDDMAAYAFSIAEEEDTHEPITFRM